MAIQPTTSGQWFLANYAWPTIYSQQYLANYVWPTKPHHPPHSSIPSASFPSPIPPIQIFWTPSGILNWPPTTLSSCPAGYIGSRLSTSECVSALATIQCNGSLVHWLHYNVACLCDRMGEKQVQMAVYGRTPRRSSGFLQDIILNKSSNIKTRYIHGDWKEKMRNWIKYTRSADDNHGSLDV